ncbi:MAG TPA: ATP-binding cassette domain-containing protein [Virgibacillus sp.]|nr:ATP-binding cassette domain-containing protein [Virgibacillus sp.]
MSDNKDEIILRGVIQNNLKNINVNIPKEKITVLTGVSGSGKSSLAFDTLAVESRRQMTMNYPLYVRNQMPKYERPQAEAMKNLSPVVVVEQRPAGGHSRSTVGTYMDIDPFIRLLFSRIGRPSVSSASDFLTRSSFGKCPECNGFGEVVTPDLNKLVDFDKSLRNHAVTFKPLSPSGWQGRWMMTGGLFDPDKPIKDYSKEMLRLFIHGPDDGEKVFAPFHTKNGPQDHEWDGLLPRFIRLYINRDVSKLKQVSEEDILAVSTRTPCLTCKGSGLNPKVLTCQINRFNIVDYGHMELTEILKELKNMNDPLAKSIARQAIPLLNQLIEMGLGYLSLSRKMSTLSGGEVQRVKIARHLGSSLNNITYIFDEPSAGLHPEEVDMLIHMLKRIKEHHNTVIVIEHNPSIINIADDIIEMGPEAGINGGEIVYQGSRKGLKNINAITTTEHKRSINAHPRDTKNWMTVEGADHHNLKNIDVSIPEMALTSICGVSGSGKSTLMLEAFAEKYPDMIMVRQERIGVSSRSTLATYMGIMDDIRAIFSKHTGQPAGLFSFNSLGACPICEGKGVTTPDVAFADPVTIPCEACGGLKYSEEALSYRYRGKNIIETLNLTIDEASTYFDLPKILKRVRTLKDVGLGYLTLGQSTPSLSGGEVQRLKLASHLQKEGQIYLLDEPSLGLHARDNAKLLDVFQTLVDRGNSVIIIEHNLDFIAASDWIVELGPGGGAKGGYILFEGRPETLLQRETPTSKWLKRSKERCF